MDQEELIRKLAQIEEQAQLTLEEFPKSLTKERLHMIIALVRYIRAESSIAMRQQESTEEDRFSSV